MTDRRCDNSDEHYFHAYTAVIERECTGITECGARHHAPHKYQSTERFWCHGICKCSPSMGLHGPGSHK